MKIKYPWWEPKIEKEEKKLILQVLDDNFPNEGDLVVQFENDVANLLDVKYAVSVTSGTSAMFLSLKALGIGPGDEVIVPDLTFIATANAVDMCGATPVLVDIDSDTLNISSYELEKAINNKTKAIMPVHVTGRPADMTAILEIADNYSLFVVEDAAEAFMSKNENTFLGTHGITGCFSFSPNKIITTGQGGLIVTNNQNIYNKLKELKDQGRSVRGTGGNDIHHSRGYNFKFTNLQAALGLGQLKYLEDRMIRLKRTHELYAENLESIDAIRVLPFSIRSGELPLWTDILVDDRDVFVNYLNEKGIDCREFWYPLHTQKPYKSSNDKFPVTSKISKRALWIPSAFTLNDEDILYIINIIRQFFK